MNIPFYRWVRYDDDGVDIYQCLKCGAQIGVRDGAFDPAYCCYCGIRYEGRILKRQVEYISLPSYEKTEFVVQRCCIWDSDDDKSPGWENLWMQHENPKIALEYMRAEEQSHKKEIEKNEKKGLNNWFIEKYRIIPVKKKCYRYPVKIDKMKFYKKTGKFFTDKMRKEIEDRYKEKKL